jgi:hypothetical protein
MTTCRILAVYEEPASAARAIAEVRERKLGEVSVYAPVPSPGLDAALQTGASPVRRFTLIGGLLGCACGFALTIYTSVDWPMITGGKPIVSIPTFMVIAFELTILLAVLASWLGFVVSARLPRFEANPLYDGRFSEDRYGVLVTGSQNQSTAIRASLERFGAEEIRGENT